MKPDLKIPRGISAVALTVLLVAGAFAAAPPAATEKPVVAAPRPLPSVAEARERARLLHETLHATLQIVHHQYYRENQGLQLPARTLKQVFAEVARRSDVRLQWLAVNTDAQNIDHNPKTEFEQNAAKSLATGKPEFESVEHGTYRRAGAITLHDECLSCHFPNRTTAKERTAGLIISMPVKKE